MSSKDHRSLAFVAPTPIRSNFRLRVAECGRHLVDQTGQPFFWLGDTGWVLFTALMEEGAEAYFEDRREKGFNVVQCVIAHWSLDHFHANLEDRRPWLNNDPAIPDEAYFEHVDALVRMAQGKGIVLGLLPAWGQLVVKDRVVNRRNARTHGRWLGSRYRESPNLVWILGGDCNPPGFEDVYRDLAAGLCEGDGGRHLITYHPEGRGTSADFWHGEPWLDFNMEETGHDADYSGYRWTLADYAKVPPKPVVDGEPRYEENRAGLEPDGSYLDALEVRKAAYQSVFSGAMGHTYDLANLADGSNWNRPRLPWREAMGLPGASHMGYLKAFMLALPWQRLRPYQGIVAGGSGMNGAYAAAARSEDGDIACIYSPNGQTIAANLDLMECTDLSVSWFNPRNGSLTNVGRIAASGGQSFTPPGGDSASDYVLVLESAARESR